MKSSNKALETATNLLVDTANKLLTDSIDTDTAWNKANVAHKISMNVMSKPLNKIKCLEAQARARMARQCAAKRNKRAIPR